MTAASLGLAATLGWLVARLILPRELRRPRWAAWLFELSLGAGLGAALGSLIYFCLLALGAAQWAIVAGVEALLLIAVAAVTWRRRPAGDSGADRAPPPLWSRMLALALLLGMTLVLAAFLEAARRNPAGDWDAWSIWNLRARFLAADGELWRHAYSPLLSRTHPEYPLLLPLFVARTWSYTDGFPAGVPIAVALLFQFAAIGLAVSAVLLLRSTTAGLLAGLILIANRSYLEQGPSQYADVPVSFYLAGSFVLLLAAQAAREGRRKLVAFAGALAGFAAWTKDEGLVFFAAVAAALALSEWRTGGWKEAGRRCSWFAAGAVPGIAVTAGFKLILAPSLTLFMAQSGAQVLARLTDPGRYITTAAAFLSEALAFGSLWSHPLLLLGVLAAALWFRPDPRVARGAAMGAAALSLVLAAYFAAYVMTPLDLEWHLSTSLRRLYTHLWPAALVLVFMVLRTPEEAAPKVRERAGKGGKRRSRRG